MRWRTAVEVALQTKAWAPKTANTTNATAGVVVRARARCVSVSITSPTRMMAPRLTRRVRAP